MQYKNIKKTYPVRGLARLPPPLEEDMRGLGGGHAYPVEVRGGQDHGQAVSILPGPVLDQGQLEGGADSAGVQEVEQLAILPLLACDDNQRKMVVDAS